MKALLLIALATLAACTAAVTRETVPNDAGPREQPAQPHKPLQREPEPQPQPEPEPEPIPVVTVHPACDGVAAEVLEIPPEWTLRVLHVEPELPMPEDSDAFFYGLDGLDDSWPGNDALDRDLFYVHAHYGSLGQLYVRYPKLDRALVREAKLFACDRAIAGDLQ